MVNKELRLELKAFMEENGKTASAIARGIGYSPTALSQWFNFNYKGSLKKIEAAITTWLKTQKEKAERGFKEETEFVENSISERVFEVADYCQVENEIGVVYGPAGIGKTEAIKEFHRRNPSTILIHATLGYTAKVLFQEIHRVLGMDGVGKVHSLFQDVVNRLEGSDRMILIDESEYLPYRALELIRRVYDLAGIGVVLVGTPKLIGNLRGTRGEYAQLYSRVGVKAALSVLDIEDTKLFVRNRIPNSNGIYKVFHQVSMGNSRILNKLIKRSIRMAELNELPIDKDLVAEAGKTLLI